MVAEHETWGARRIHQAINSSESNTDVAVPLADVEKLVDSNFKLYSLGFNGIRFRRNNLDGVCIEVGNYLEDKIGYHLQIQYASNSPDYAFKLTALHEFFKKNHVKIDGDCKVETEDLTLEKAIDVYGKLEQNIDSLKW